MSGTVAMRCYTGPGVGAGHLMRCRELARELKSRGWRTLVMGPAEALRDDGDAALFDVWTPAPDEFDSATDAEAFLELCSEHGARHAIMDDYRIDPGYQRRLMAAGLYWLQQFDSSRPWDFWADILVNAGPHERVADYERFLRNPRAKILFGPEYAVLRPEFAAVQPREDGWAVEALFVSFGGGDDRGLIGRSVEALAPLVGEALRLAIVSGRENPGNARYADRFSGDAFVDFHVAPPDMPGLMRSCDLALLAGGTMSYEAAICGLPLILVSAAKNQERACMGWQERIGAQYLGPADQVSQDAIRDAVVSLSADRDARAKMSSLGRAAVDGLGAARLVDALLDE